MRSSNGFKNALAVFRMAARKVPAYKHILKSHKVSAVRITTPEDFQAVPVTDKKSYIYKFKHEELLPEGQPLPPLLYASSGSSGKPTYWWRGDAEEARGGEIHDRVFRDIFGIKKNEPTLVIVCYSMGVWVAGGYTMESCRHLSRKGYQLTTVTPGMEKEDIFNALKNMAPEFRHVVVVGYPPFLMDVFVEAEARGIRLKDLSLKVLTAGDRFSESWRSELLKLLGQEEAYHSLVSMYGSADGMVLGYETPLTTFLRRRALYDRELYKDVFGESEDQPAFVQYDPRHVYFEEVGGELVFTMNNPIPLVRYNIHDIGTLLQPADVKRLIRKHGLERAVKKHGTAWYNLPALVLKGRSDVAVTFYALNIFPEHIRAGIQDRRIQKFLSGNFMAYNQSTDNERRQKLCIRLELAPRVQVSKKLAMLAQNAIAEHLAQKNIEYRKLSASLGGKALPEIELSPFGDARLLRKNVGGVLEVKGKKPKIIL